MNQATILQVKVEWTYLGKNCLNYAQKSQIQFCHSLGFGYKIPNLDCISTFLDSKMALSPRCVFLFHLTISTTSVSETANF